ncbi:hypothetical protein BC826DRAFT_1072955, partial [Russula brevipes]
TAAGRRHWDPSVVELPFSPFPAGRRFLGFRRCEFLQKATCPVPIGFDRGELHTTLKELAPLPINRSVHVGSADG